MPVRASRGSARSSREAAAEDGPARIDRDPSPGVIDEEAGRNVVPRTFLPEPHDERRLDGDVAERELLGKRDLDPLLEEPAGEMFRVPLRKLDPAAEPAELVDPGGRLAVDDERRDPVADDRGAGEERRGPVGVTVPAVERVLEAELPAGTVPGGVDAEPHPADRFVDRSA